jgi:cystathionine beta-lyase
MNDRHEVLGGALLGPLRLEVEHAARDRTAGPVLRVFELASGRERLRFECDLGGGAWQVDPTRAGERGAIPNDRDPLDWLMDQLRSGLDGWLARVGLHVKLDADEVGRALERIEAELRNPPLDLDDVDPEQRRARSTANWKLYGPDALPAWVAEMDYATPEPVRRVLQRDLDLGDFGYPFPGPYTPLPQVFASRMAERYGWSIAPERTELLADVVQGIYVALDRFSEPGDGVVVQTPIYPPFLEAIAETGRELRANPLVRSPAGFELGLDDLEQQARGARVLLFCHPHNPTGRVWRRDELERVAAIALASDLLVISDEIHADLAFPGQRHLPFASLGPEIEERTLTLTSATKSFNLPGLRCAIAAFGSREQKRRFNGVPRHLRGGLGNLGIDATVAAWRHAQPWLERVLSHLDESRRWLESVLPGTLPGVRFTPPEASYLAWLDCSDLALEPSAAEFFLEHARVALGAGERFGPGGEGCVRLSFATSRPLLEEMIHRMGKALRDR